MDPMKNLIFALGLLLSLSSFACEQVTSSVTISDPADGADFTVAIKAYQPKNYKKNPAIFILPPIVGETVLDRTFAERFCNNGMASFILNVVKIIPREVEVTDLSIHDNSYLRALAGVRATMDKLSTDPGLNGDFGILGMSLGGMLSAYVAGSEPRIKASVVIVGAGNVPGVLTFSAQELVVTQRQDRIKHFGLKDQKSYEELLKSKVTHDPLAVAGNIAPETTYLFIARGDSTVPTKFQRQLAEAIREPLIYEMRGGHFEGIVKAGTVHAGKITSFFLSQLKR